MKTNKTKNGDKKSYHTATRESGQSREWQQSGGRRQGEGKK